MSDFHSAGYQSAYRHYLRIERVKQSMDGFRIPQDEQAEFLRSMSSTEFGEHGRLYPGSAPRILAWAQSRTSLEFIQRYLHAASDEVPALFSYSHDPRRVSQHPQDICGEAQLDPQRRAAADRIGPLDVVCVYASSFERDPEGLFRVLQRLTETNAMVMIERVGFESAIDLPGLTRWLNEPPRHYIPVKANSMDCLFRPELPTGPGTFG